MVPISLDSVILSSIIHYAVYSVITVLSQILYELRNLKIKSELDQNW